MGAGVVRALEELGRYPFTGQAGSMGTRAFPPQDADEVLGPSRRRAASRCRAEPYDRAHREAGQPLADPGGLTGRTGPAVWQAVQRHRNRTRR
ncbi:MAG: hypothetical protein Kow0092_24960 [Deferrisomatales bacterium]